MVEGFEQHYQETAEEIAELLHRELPGNFVRSWIHAVMEDGCGDVACYYTVASEPGKAFRLSDNGANVDLYFIFYQLRERMAGTGDKPWTTAAFMLSSKGEFGIELGYEDLARQLEKGQTAWDLRQDRMTKYMPGVTSVVE